MRCVPAGLDGNPDPIVTPERAGVLDLVLHALAAVNRPRVLVGIDGAPGTGKSTFADEVAMRLARVDLDVIRSTTDSFHRPRVERYRRGPASPHGYYLDSHDLDAIIGRLLRPFASGARRVQIAAFDEAKDIPSPAFASVASERSVLVFDGLFLLRPELAGHWDLTVHLVAEQRRDEGWRSYLYDDLPARGPERQDEIDARLDRARWPRYRDGWRLYVEQVDPADVATIVVDNDDFAAPRVLAESITWPPTGEPHAVDARASTQPSAEPEM